ncbi:MAG: hypothetical protein A4E67_01357 [Syntrophaceae bacterium PtaB.Bin038]|nr:MAG: hypothetical protein A4E67_01357 [Syntrophaceae bacterium PtaB.Bin038]
MPVTASISTVGAPISPVLGRFASSIPNAIGNSSKGSNPFTIAKYSRMNVITSMIPCWIVMVKNPVLATSP